MTTGYTPYLVANKRTAIDLSLTDSWITPDDAFVEMFDGYNYKGVSYKRDGYSFFASFPTAVGTVYQSVTNITTVVPAVVTVSSPHGLVNGQVIQLTGVVGITGGDSPINGTRWTVLFIDPLNFSLNNVSPFTGAYASGGTVSGFLGNPITMIASWINPANNQATMVVCDTKRAAYFDSTSLILTPIGVTNQFSGTFPFKFWYENYFGYLFITNNQDTIFYYNGTNAQNTTGLTIFKPQYGPLVTDVVNTCLMIKGVAGRLVLFNTVEAGTRHATRIRWCKQNVDPTLAVVVGPPRVQVWSDTIPGNGGFFDLLSTTYIITLGRIQDNVLIVSQVVSQGQQSANHYQMSITSDPERPYLFNVISSSRNVNSTFGTIILDRENTMVGAAGLVRSDGNTTDRYDARIPEFAIDNIDQESFQNCFGIRYDQLWQSWLLFTPQGKTTNTQALVFNYQDRAWSIYRWDTSVPGLGFNVMGLFPNPLPDPTWASMVGNWLDQGDATWQSLAENAEVILLGGDYLGNIWIMNDTGGDASENVIFGSPPDSGLPIFMDWTTRQWFPYAKDGKAAQLGYVDLLLLGDPETVVTMEFSIDNNFFYQNPSFTCVNFNNLQFGPIQNISQAVLALVTAPNHALITGNTIYIFGVQGMIQVNDVIVAVTVVDTDHFTIPIDSSAFPAYVSGGIWTTKQLNFNTFWTRIWAGQVGTFHQFRFINQGVNENFELHAQIYNFKATGRIYQGG